MIFVQSKPLIIYFFTLFQSVTHFVDSQKIIQALINYPCTNLAENVSKVEHIPKVLP